MGDLASIGWIYNYVDLLRANPQLDSDELEEDYLSLRTSISKSFYLVSLYSEKLAELKSSLCFNPEVEFSFSSFILNLD